MLKILNMQTTSTILGKDGEKLFAVNPTINFRIEAPLYWWVDIDWVKYRFDMPTSNFKFCKDAFLEYDPKRDIINTLESHLNTLEVEPRKLMQLLPLSTIVEGVIKLSYQEIVEICENYVAGDYCYVKGFSFPNEREWKDFCETLFDVQGIRDLVEEDM